MAPERPDPLKSAFEIIKNGRDFIIRLVREKDYSLLLLVICVTFWFFLRPNGGLISESFAFKGYNVIFYLTEITLFLLSILLGLLDNRLPSPDPASKKLGLRVFSILFGFVTFLTCYNLFFSGQAPSPPDQNSLACEIREEREKNKNCFSFGSTILIGKEYLGENGQEVDWKKACLEGWYLKDLNRYDQFIEECPNDAESHIYYLNGVSGDSELEIRKGRNENDLIKIAVSLPISRKGGLTDSQEVLRGVAMAQYAINEDENSGYSIDGKKLKIGIADDGFDSDTSDSFEGEKHSSVRVAEFLLNRPDIVGVIGHFSSDATQAASKVYQNALVTISPTSTATRRSDENPNGLDIGKYVFRTSPNDYEAATSLAHKADSSAAIIYESDSLYSQSFKEAFESSYKKLGGEVVTVCDFSKIKSFSPEACLESALNGNAKDILFVPSTKNSEKVAMLINSNFSLGQRKLSLLGSDSMYDESFAREETIGMLVAVPWHRSNSYLEKKAEELFGNGGINWRTAMAYDATMSMVQGLKDASILCSFPRYVLNPFQKDGLSKCLRRKLQEVLIGSSNLKKESFYADGSLGEKSVEFDERGDRVVSSDSKGLGVIVEVTSPGVFKCVINCAKD